MKKRLVIALGVLGVGALILLGSAAGGYFASAKRAEAVRDSSGTHTLPTPGVPFQAGSVVDSTQMNNTLSDISSTLTDSKSRSGKGDFTAAVRGVDGTVSSPAYSWTSESGSGWYRIGASDVGMSVSGAKVGEWTANGLKMPTTAPLNLNSKGANPSVEFNLVYDGANQTYLSTAPGAIMEMDGSGTMNFYTAPSGTSGTTATVTKQLTVSASGVTMVPNVTASGTLSTTGALTIGSGGTAISKSLRGTTVWNPGTVASNTAATAGMTITGAVAGADCVAGVVDPSPLTGYPVQCITTTNNCNIAIRNQQNTGFTFGSATFYCRVFNP